MNNQEINFVGKADFKQKKMLILCFKLFDTHNFYNVNVI